MSSPPEPVLLDLGDFDAVGIATDLVLDVRRLAFETDADAGAAISAPEGWHRLVVTAKAGGHVVLAVRYTDLSPSRHHNVSGALAGRGWDEDEDHDGATRRFPPGTDATDVAFEMLAVLTSSGAPSDVREVSRIGT